MMRFSIGFKVVIGVAIVMFMVVGHTTYTMWVNQVAIGDAITEDAVIQAELLMADIDNHIGALVHDMEVVSACIKFDEDLTESNMQFEQMVDPEGFIERTDAEWRAASEDEPLPLMSDILGNQMSAYIRHAFSDPYDHEYGKSPFEEVIITNAFGATVAMSSTTATYRQDLHAWWRDTLVNDQHVSIGYDVNSNLSDLIIAMEITDDDGEAVGILKGSVNFLILIRGAEIDSMGAIAKEIFVISDEGLKVYHTKPFIYLEDVSEEAFYKNIEGEQGHFTIEESDRTSAVTYARSKGSSHFDGFNWTLLILEDADEIYYQLNQMKRDGVYFFIALIILTVAIEAVVIRSITRPLRSLVEGTREISNGNFTHRIDVSSNDEIRDLAREFNDMGDKLASSYESMELMVRSRTKDLAIANQALLSARVGVAITGEDGSLRLANEAMMDFLDVSTSTDVLDMDLKDTLAEVGVTEENWADRCEADFLDGVCELATRREGKGLRYYVIASYPVTDDDGHPSGTVLFVRDITKGKVAEVQLQITLSELERSNEALEQFANIASHDLQEPLRMVSSYLQLLERRYKGQLDEDANEFIGYAVDGASRMQDMIRALLEFSRITTRGQPLIPVDLDRAYRNAVANLELLIEEAGAHLEKEELGWALGDEKQLTMLLQNLLNNGIKFRGEHPPRISVSSRVENGTVTVSVIDNGIGINPRFSDKIFSIFQRLHTREEYPGSGIGLALCRRIVERHNGNIWVDQCQGPGSTFNFTLNTSKGTSDLAQERTS